MGATLSNLTEGSGANGTGNGPGLGDIPESCVACVFMYLTPPEICNLARLNRAFRGAASSNAVWESKLPSNYQDLLDLLPPDRHLNLSKKGIFALLSRPILFEDGNRVRACLFLFYWEIVGRLGFVLIASLSLSLFGGTFRLSDFFLYWWIR